MGPITKIFSHYSLFSKIAEYLSRAWCHLILLITRLFDFTLPPHFRDKERGSIRVGKQTQTVVWFQRWLPPSPWDLPQDLLQDGCLQRSEQRQKSPARPGAISQVSPLPPAGTSHSWICLFLFWSPCCKPQSLNVPSLPWCHISGITSCVWSWRQEMGLLWLGVFLLGLWGFFPGQEKRVFCLHQCSPGQQSPVSLFTASWGTLTAGVC